MTQTGLISAGIKAVGLYYLIQGILRLLSGFALAIGHGTLGTVAPAVWWGNIFAAAIGAYLVADGSLVSRAASGERARESK